MKWMAARVVYTTAHTPLDMTTDLISNIFYDFLLQGVVVEDDAVTGYFPVDDRLEIRCKSLESALYRLQKMVPMEYRVEYAETEEEDWAEAWKAFFKPERIGRNLVVKPTWEDYRPGPGDIILEIDPGMAFGTGTHPSTALCLEMLEDHLRPGHKVIDVGTGSGILMIAAAKLGAGRIVGIDKDPLAVNIAETNMKQNRIPAESYRVKTGDLIEGMNERFDVMVANILTEVNLILLDHVRDAMAENGRVILSGITETKACLIQDKMAMKGITLLETRVKDSWAAIVGTIP